MMKKFLVLVTGLLLSGSVCATDLLAVYQDALQHDPAYLNAIASYHDAREALPQAQAQLLPLIGTDTMYLRHHTRPKGSGPNTSFTDKTFTASLTQPVINFAYWAQVSGARATTTAAYATLQDAKQSLITRVAAAYFNVLLAEDSLRFTLAEKRAVAQQLEQTKQRFRVGLDAITSVYNAQAKFDSIRAKEIGSRNDLQNAFEQLRQITGKNYTALLGFRSKVPLISPNPQNVEKWVMAAEKGNFSLSAAINTTLAANAVIKQQFAGHLPTLEAVASYTATRTNDPAKTQSHIHGGQASFLGAELKFPIFAGGAVNSLTRQAAAQYQEAYTLQDSTHRRIVSSTRQTYNDITAGASSIKADRQTLHSQQSSLNGTIAAFKVGTRTIVEVLNDQQTLTQVQQQYATDQYTYMNNLLKLQQLVGSLSEQELAKINAWLEKTNVKSLTSADPKVPAKKTTAVIKPAVAQKAPPTAKPANFAIQLASFSNIAHAQAFMKAHQLNKKASIKKQNYGHRAAYHVLLGQYDSYRSAKAAIAKLPQDLAGGDPWVVFPQ